MFALVNLPEVVKGALFARYSRSSKSLRRLFLDEFVGDLDVTGDAGVDATMGLRRAEELYDRVFLEYGDDSVAQLGGVHLACEQASNMLTKVLEWGRLMAYLEQSTRYIPYDSRLGTGHYRYYRDPEVLESSLGARYVGDMDRMFDTYGALLPELQAWLARRYPAAARRLAISSTASRSGPRPSTRCAACCRRRRCRTSASTARASPTRCCCCACAPTRFPRRARYAAADARRAAQGDPLVPPAGRHPRAGGVWTDYFADTAAQTDERGRPRCGPTTTSPAEQASAVTLVDLDPEGEDKVIAAMCYPHIDAVATTRSCAGSRALGAEERRWIMRAYVGERTQPPAPPGPGLRAHRLPLRHRLGLRRLP